MRVSVFSRTTGYRHDSIPAGVAALRELGAEHGFDIDAGEDPAVFTPDRLARYRAVIFLSTSGTVFDDDAQRAALESYVRGGGGYVGIHGASTTEYDWPFYGELVGARFTGHPRIQPARVGTRHADHPATVHLPSTWDWTDEWYNFADRPGPGVRVLLDVDESSYEGGTMGTPHPIAWCHRIGAGRSFYTALGHGDEHYDQPMFRRHLLGGIRYAIGTHGGDA